MKPRLRILTTGEMVPVADEAPLDRARRRHGRPFAHERGANYDHVNGVAYWTPDRISQLAADNEARRRARQR